MLRYRLYTSSIHLSTANRLAVRDLFIDKVLPETCSQSKAARRGIDTVEEGWRRSFEQPAARQENVYRSESTLPYRARDAMPSRSPQTRELRCIVKRPFSRHSESHIGQCGGMTVCIVWRTRAISKAEVTDSWQRAPGTPQRTCLNLDTRSLLSERAYSESAKAQSGATTRPVRPWPISGAAACTGRALVVCEANASCVAVHLGAFSRSAAYTPCGLTPAAEMTARRGRRVRGCSRLRRRP
jgi:hypothetical protein